MSPIVGFAGIVFALWFAASHEGGGQGFFSPAGIVLLALGPPCVMLLSHTLLDFVTGIRLLVQSMTGGSKRHQIEVLDTLTAASKSVRADGVGAVIPFRDKARYGLLRDGLSLIVNDFKPEEIRNNLTARVNLKQSHMQLAANLFENMSKLSPGVGMIGTLMGLIAMLANINDPQRIAPNMSLAMITTLYGLALGTIIYGPWSERIALEAERTLEIDLLVVEGVLNIKGKKSSMHLRDLVKSYSVGEAASKSKGAAPEPAGRKGA